jgi:hypothetical protein
VFADELLERQGVARHLIPSSSKRFADGADFRTEIPSVEGPVVMAAVLREAEKQDVIVNRVSQGSGAMLLSEGELTEMARMGADHGLEVSLFVGPREEWGIAAQSRSSDGGSLSGNVRGSTQLRYAVEDVLRAVDCGIRGFLVADIGLLSALFDAQEAGEIPAGVVWKISALISPSNALTLRVLERLGADTVNVPSDLTFAELAELRAASDIPLDLYLETSESVGGVVRGEQLADLVSVGAPLYAKYGLRNSRGLYPAGAHLVEEAVAIATEKVHRAKVSLEWLRRAGSSAIQSERHAPGLGIPVV